MRWDKPRPAQRSDSLTVVLIMASIVVLVILTLVDFFIYGLSSACIDACPAPSSAAAGHAVALFAWLGSFSAFVILTLFAVSPSAKLGGNGSVIALAIIPAMLVAQWLGGSLIGLMVN
ncbi:hypothetical protein GCM10025867_51150 (plasmid) [Frondihabitans sucicola]|uniref:Uncharacterized protein n=1 Tax=Frondihabitans sucicola TaxID=1268041 RepID=A0ABN6Y833_9MICO|nr:hypothetical protein [Frondihabitans sucicola]BDZ52307.1 hypothetical protein GCM10025867_45480 [Frondihabitans sucicola]BDZ52874.1 hypothetical protein GCM10025867_51150 [Frondihabitans sucicola]